MARRGRGEGSLYRRASDGVWVASVTLGRDEDGKRVRKTVYGATRSEAAARLTELLYEQGRGVLVAPDRITVREFLEWWLTSVVKPDHSENTYTAYRNAVQKGILPTIGHIQLQKLAPSDIQDLKGALTRKVAPITANHRLTILRTALDLAQKQDYVSRNVAKLVDKPRFRVKEQRAWTEEQARAFLKAVKDEPLYPLFALALATGMRRGELLALQWQDLDLERGVVHVRATLVRVVGRVEPKTPHSRRDIPLSPSLVAVLRAHKAHQGAKHMKLGIGKGEAAVFTKRTGERAGEAIFLGPMVRACEAAGVPVIRFHDIRHSAASIMLKSGIPIKVVSEMLGHASVNVTLSVYAHYQEGDKEQAAAIMGRLLG